MSAEEEEAPAQLQQREEEEKKPEEAQAAAPAPGPGPGAAPAPAPAPGPDPAPGPAPGPGPPAAQQKSVSIRALVLTGHGGYDKVKLQVKTQEEPRPEPGQVLLRVRACGLNFSELLARQGLYDRLPPPPVIMGMEGSGVIEAVGEGVDDRKVGDRVIAISRSGMWQELMVLPADQTFAMPEEMSFEEGAALPVNYLTAYLMLFDMANLRPGKSVLVHMAAGGVGVAATQLCRTVADVTVFGTASASKHETISRGGVSHPIDYRTLDYVEEVRKISPNGVDIVLDPLGGSDTQKGFSLLKPLGTLITFGAANILTGPKRSLFALAKTWYQQLSLGAVKLMQSNKTIGGFHLGFLADEGLIRSTLLKLVELYRQGKIKPRVDSRYHFEEVSDAMRRMHERQNIGKVVLIPEAKAVETETETEAVTVAPEDAGQPPTEEEEKKDAAAGEGGDR